MYDKLSEILVVDDVQANLQVLNQILRTCNYKVRLVTSGQAALNVVKTNPPDLILLDITMPEMDGYEVCSALKEDPEFKDIPIIFISGLTDTLDKVKAFDNGGVDYITKPFQAEEVLARISTHLKIASLQNQLQQRILELKILADKQVKSILEQQDTTIFNLALFAQMLDDDSEKHLNRMSQYCQVLAKQLKTASLYAPTIPPSYVENITLASRLYDIGKISLPSDLLLKSTSAKLTLEEQEGMKMHTVLTDNVLKLIKKDKQYSNVIEMITHIIQYHHERWDGAGYPNGLKTTNIPLAARIVSVVNVYDAFMAKRCHVDMNHEQVVRIVKGAAFTYFDPIIVDMFIKIHKKFQEIWENNQ